ncbi:MAG: hypothetical protein ACXVEF_25440 [Polyangiales bacterium]
MSASLSYSVASLASDPSEAEEALLAVAQACSGIEFFDKIGDRSVRVIEGRIEDAPAPPHAGQSITRDARDRFFLFEDHGDILLPGWDPSSHEFEIEVGGEARVLGDLGQMAAEIDEMMADGELDVADREFLGTVRKAIEIARAEKLAIVAHW